jgi:hypothetical protein
MTIIAAEPRYPVWTRLGPRGCVTSRMTRVEISRVVEYSVPVFPVGEVGDRPEPNQPSDGAR